MATNAAGTGLVVEQREVTLAAYDALPASIRWELQNAAFNWSGTWARRVLREASSEGAAVRRLRHIFAVDLGEEAYRT